MIFSIFSLIALTLSSSVLALPNGVQPEKQVKQVTFQNALPGNGSYAALQKTSEHTTYQGLSIGEALKGDQNGLIWTKVCEGKAWNADYIFACVVNDQIAFTDYIFPVSHEFFQGPKIRLSPDGPNFCAQIGGAFTIFRSRNSGAFQNIWAKSFNGLTAYDGKDAIFLDDYGMDC
jgi:hypothetical protein